MIVYTFLQINHFHHQNHLLCQPTNPSTFSRPIDHSSTDECMTYATNSSLTTENSSPKSSLKVVPADVSQTGQDSTSQSRLSAYPLDKEHRSFQVKSYINRPWMEYSIELDSVFCYYCRHFHNPGYQNGSKNLLLQQMVLTNDSVLWRVIEALTNILRSKHI